MCIFLQTFPAEVTLTSLTGINDDMVKSSNTSAVAAATGRSWDDWVTLLDQSDDVARPVRRTPHEQHPDRCPGP